MRLHGEPHRLDLMFCGWIERLDWEAFAVSNVFEKDRWYLRPRVRSGSLISPPTGRFRIDGAPCYLRPRELSDSDMPALVPRRAIS
jgi:hypothetical protein